MTKYKYLLQHLPSEGRWDLHTKKLSIILESAGERGWELVQVLTNGYNNPTTLVFKQPIPPEEWDTAPH